MKQMKRMRFGALVAVIVGVLASLASAGVFG